MHLHRVVAVGSVVLFILSGCSSDDSPPAGAGAGPGPGVNEAGTPPSSTGDGGTTNEASTDVTVPGAPANVAAVGDYARGATVTWDAPASDGGSPILSYTVTASPSGKTLLVPGNKRSATILGLPAGEAETFTIFATNAVGDGPPSSATLPVTPPVGLDPPTLSVCGGTEKVHLAATTVVGATSTNVYYGTAPGVTRLNGTKVANPTFPFEIANLMRDTPYYFVVTAVDGDGLESTESAEVQATSSANLHNVLFAASFSANAIAITDCFDQVATGATAVTRTITGPATTIAAHSYNAVFADVTHRDLYFASDEPAILVWENADTVTGDVAPTRKITGDATKRVYGMWVDHAHDRLYAGNREASSVSIWANASTVTGAVAPTATISGANTTFGQVFQIAVDEARDVLYVSNYNSVLVFDNVSALTGEQNIAPSRTIAIPSLFSLGLGLDSARDTLYVGSRDSGGSVYTVTGASTANNTVTPAHKLGGLTGVNNLIGVQVVDDTLYTFEDSGTAVLEWPGAHAVDGSTAATRTVGVGVANLSGAYVVH